MVLSLSLASVVVLPFLSLGVLLQMMLLQLILAQTLAVLQAINNSVPAEGFRPPALTVVLISGAATIAFVARSDQALVVKVKSKVATLTVVPT